MIWQMNYFQAEIFNKKMWLMLIVRILENKLKNDKETEMVVYSAQKFGIFYELKYLCETKNLNSSKVSLSVQSVQFLYT